MKLGTNDSAGNAIRVVSPTWSAIEESIRRIDGEHIVEMSLMMDEDRGLFISGGYHGHFLVQLISQPQSSWLILPERSRTRLVEIVKDEGAIYNEYMTVPLDVALNTAKIFYEGADLTNMNWETAADAN